MIPTFVTRTLPSAWILLEATRANVNQDDHQGNTNKTCGKEWIFCKMQLYAYQVFSILYLHSFNI